MDKNIHHKFSGHLCAKCGGPAPGWKCASCGGVANHFDSHHFKVCPKQGKLEAQCLACTEAESKCTC